jgi:hypothetical protein
LGVRTPGHKLSVGILLFAWLLVNLVLFYKTGVKIVADTERYIEYANGLRSGFYFDSHNFWYIGYVSYLLLIFKISGSVGAVVVGQYLFSVLAVIALYRAAFLLGNSTASALATCLLFIGFTDILMWNSYVLTESLYTSFICFSIYCLVVIYNTKARRTFVALGVFVILFTILMKPTGLALLVAIVTVLLVRTKSIALISVSLILLVILVNRMLTTFVLVENYRAGEIIYAASEMVVEKPADLTNPSSSYPLLRVVLFIVQNPVYWTKLFVLKVYYLLFHTRPFWSIFHNLFSLIVLIPSYILFFKGIKNADRDIVVFTSSFLLIHILSVGFTADDWDGRFLIPMLPVIFIFTGHGFNSLIKWKE